MRLWIVAAVAAFVSFSAPARACGVEVSPFGGGGAAHGPTKGFIFASGGVATHTSNGVDSRSTAPFFMTGVGAEVYEQHGVHFAPMVDAIVRSRANVATSTDVALVSRVSSTGFVDGGFGAAIDLGVWTRVHGGHAIGPLAGLTLGAPAGVQASWIVQHGDSDVRGFAVVVGFDLARVR